MQEKIFRFFLGDQLTDKPSRRKGPGHGERSKVLAYVFMGASDPGLANSARTYSSLMKIADGDVRGLKATYWTPNTFYRSDERSKKTLRWLNALFIDIDEEGLCVLDVLNRITAAGLPAPTMVNETPHGWHAYWAIEPVRAWPKAVALYDAITRAMVGALVGSDPKAYGAERYVRIPRNVKHFNEVRYLLSDFVSWRDVSEESKPVTEKARVHYITGCLSQPGIKALLEGVESGKRDSSAFTLALAFYKDGFSREEATSNLLEWNKKNEPPLPERIIHQKVKSAYSGKYRGPSSAYVCSLTGISLSYRPITPAKPRKERVRDHLAEIQGDIIRYIENNSGRVELSQSEFATVLNVSLSSFKMALKALRRAGKVIALIAGLGRARKAIYALLESISAVIRELVQRGAGQFDKFNQLLQKIMVHSDIHLLDEVVGGFSLGLQQDRYLVSQLE